MTKKLSRWRLISSAAALALSSTPALAEKIWVEGEKPARSTMVRHPWWYERVQRTELSGGDYIANFDKDVAGVAEYDITAAKAGEYKVYLRGNPIQATMSIRVNDGEWTKIDMAQKISEQENIADDGNPDLRFLAWIDAGKFQLHAGKNTISFRCESERYHHGAIDAFVVADEPFVPMGILRPEQMILLEQKMRDADKGWLPFTPKADYQRSGSPIDLRSLNEKFAGEHGFIQAKGDEFILGSTGQSVRFWGVNGPPIELTEAQMKQSAAFMARYGINLARLHGAIYDASGNIKPEEITRRIQMVRAMKEQGIYTHLSIYFPLWMQPKPDNPWLKGYDGNKHPYAALYFNKDFQQQYREWWKALLLTPDEQGRKLIDDPAIMGAEIVNEDSYFFWTFNEVEVPDAQLRILEQQFGEWLAKKYGSIDAAIARWNVPALKRDNSAEGRVAFRPLYNMFTDRNLRDQDTAAFLAESQRNFYDETAKFLRSLGFKGLITASNWNTANAEVFGPIEKWTYAGGDFFDRHGYFGNYIQGEAAAWSLREGQTYADRSALRFENEKPRGPKSFNNPVMDITYDGKPTMISETAWTRPNRFRSEGPLFLAAYGALQDSDAIVQSGVDGVSWSVKPNFYMQPWTLMSPGSMGQFPAAAMIYRKGLVATGDVIADVQLSPGDLLALRGTPLPQDANFDELRLKDVPAGSEVKPGNVIDPLVHMVGETRASFVDKPAAAKLADITKLIDRQKQTVTSVTGQIQLNYDTGLLTINAPQANAVSGMLKAAGKTQAGILAVESDMELAHIIAVSLDGQPLEKSAKILLQVMTEERNSEFKTKPSDLQISRMVSLGKDPWQFQEIRGTVQFNRPDAAQLKCQPLDFDGYPVGESVAGPTLKLLPDRLYYVVTR